ncbi:hypothetical protein DLM45_00400 [Hyphomicrobium methylovorum]|uniref:hypothetical protein n=1 Tax=Hyphomicrobium methylovorum TaxID=84 RepID=UPI0015E662CE|nr:hypothetical protein [Hyphomicrobium methylovorum]MBA2124690.1 hypothetical protein [Hyphomicrobium methylovorum]
MATILEFKVTPRLFADRLGDADRPADILFFPGVRYERLAEAAQEFDEEALNNGQRRRDTLELES